MDVLHSCIAMIGIVVLIIGFKINAVVALLLGCLYLGLTAGLGMDATIATIAGGFGEIMTDVGLLIGFGVLLGALLSSLGAVQRLTHLLLDLVGPRRFPYAMTATFSTVFPAIYPEAQLVLAAPLVRTAAPKLGPNGLGLLAGAQAIGMAAGFMFVVPGLVAVTVSGLLGASLGTVLLFGLIVGPGAALITVAIWCLLVRRGFWKPETDEIVSTAGDIELLEGESGAEDGRSDGEDGQSGSGSGALAGVQLETRRRTPPMTVMLMPILLPLALIATSSIASATGVESGPLIWVGNPILALFIGLIGAYAIARITLGGEQTEKVMSKGLSTTGQVLLITGVGGSLGAVLAETDLKNTLGSLFSTQTGASAITVVLVAFGVAALLHLIIGSASVAAITAAGILGPIMGDLSINPAVLVLAVCAGCLFAVQVNSNIFWMFQTVMRVTTGGALKALTLNTCICSLVALPMVLVLAVFT
ncbi:GntP family permease [Gordonia sp. KTR9]|uniref:GntP family permease n=1 Tax=Gordonia sp. KTR9 TaxID=337191 RepID=UPI00027DE661|nr:SLC13 family permease [Gordonia sp. KTR9]AFR49814.1 H+/gluconate symporter-related permease [Gordonia sp. KTR9]